MTATVTIEDEEMDCAYTVEVEYRLDVDRDYGADADGHRGTTLIEVDVLDVIAAPGVPEWAIEEARTRVMEGRIEP